MELVVIMAAGWILMNVMAVSLCVSAKQGDHVLLALPAPAEVEDPGFTATIATPAAATVRPHVGPQRSRLPH